MKYKMVDKKVQPVLMMIPEEMKVKQMFPSDPLTNLLALLQHPPEFIPTKKVTVEQQSGHGCWVDR